MAKVKPTWELDGVGGAWGFASSTGNGELGTW